MSNFFEFQKDAFLKAKKKSCSYYFHDKDENIKVRAFYDTDGSETFFVKIGDSKEVEKTMVESKLLTDTLLYYNRIPEALY